MLSCVEITSTPSEASFRSSSRALLVVMSDGSISCIRIVVYVSSPIVYSDQDAARGIDKAIHSCEVPKSLR